MAIFHKFKIGEQVRVYNPTQLSLDYKLNFTYMNDPKISKKLESLYPTWGHLIGEVGFVESYSGNFVKLSLESDPELYIYINDQHIELCTYKKEDTQEIKCNCDFSVIWSSGCQCGGI